MRHLTPILLAAAFLAGQPLAHAQVAEFAVIGGTSRLSNAGIGSFNFENPREDDVELTDGWRLGFRMTLNNWRFLGHEFGYAYNRTSLKVGSDEAGMAIHQGFYNFLAYATPEGSIVRPFATGGVHFANFTPPGISVTQGGGDTKFGVNYGGGLKIRVSHSLMLRFDVRDYLTGKPFDLPGQRGKLHQLEIGVGLGIAL
ncbi:MAG: porin family protein [Bryobacterales bacterium]|nr:porin family protein [Bryobacterales bacterium]